MTGAVEIRRSGDGERGDLAAPPVWWLDFIEIKIDEARAAGDLERIRRLAHVLLAVLRLMS